MRSYKAARRAAKRAAGTLAPIPFEVVYEDDLGEEVRDTFQAYGEISAATLADFAYFADRGVDTPEGAAILRRGVMEVIGDEAEFRRFWEVARQIEDDDLLDVFSGLLEDTLARPTTPPSDSPASSSTSGQPSRAVSSPEGSSPVETSTVYSD